MADLYAKIIGTASNYLYSYVLIILLVGGGIYFTIRTRFLPFRLFPEMLRVTAEGKGDGEREGISGLQALIVSTACRVGMGKPGRRGRGDLRGRRGRGVWMWVIALLGSSTAFVEANARTAL